MEYLEVGILAMVWTVTIWRAPSAFRTPKQRALWLSFAALALAVTLRVPGIMHALDDWFHVNNLSTLIKHWTGIVAAGAVVDFVAAISRPDSRRGLRPRHYTALAAMAILAVLFQFVPREHEVTDFFQETAGSGWATTYYTVFMAYLGFAMATSTRLYWTSVRAAKGACLRFGVRLMGIGSTSGALYALVRILYLQGRLLGITTVAHDATADTFTDLLKYGAIGLILTGSSIPALGVAWRTLQDWRHLRALRPLWHDLTTAAPEIVLHAQLLRSPRLRLHRCVIEIRDAGLALAAYTSEAIRTAAQDTARAAGFDPESSPVVEALQLRAAREAKVAGLQRASSTPGALTEGIEELDFNAEVDRLLHLSRAYHSPVAHAFASRTHPGGRSGRSDRTLS
ncbi:MAB_1171c family putative transporter [Streptomyces goshikiensis]|uniref:MAB_1171c family putative transporter n=1 Tax=Streptomyces goshikiensis TaxID=1942 RepID=UPI0033DB7638